MTISELERVLEVKTIDYVNFLRGRQMADYLNPAIIVEQNRLYLEMWAARLNLAGAKEYVSAAQDWNLNYVARGFDSSGLPPRPEPPRSWRIVPASEKPPIGDLVQDGAPVVDEVPMPEKPHNLVQPRDQAVVGDLVPGWEKEAYYAAKIEVDGRIRQTTAPVGSVTIYQGKTLTLREFPRPVGNLLLWVVE